MAFKRESALLFVLLLLAVPIQAQEPCGGVERWAVKVGADQDLVDNPIDLQPVPITIHDLASLPKGGPIPNDDVSRLPAERKVYVVDGFLVKFKLEAGKHGDADYHLVVSDETLAFAQGPNNPGSTHSFIAEIVDPLCIMGRNNTVTTPSVFANEWSRPRQRLKRSSPTSAGGGMTLPAFPCASRASDSSTDHTDKRAGQRTGSSFIRS